MRAAKLSGVRRDTLKSILAGKTAIEGYLMGREYNRRRLDNRLQMAKREGYAEGYEAALKDSE